MFPKPNKPLVIGLVFATSLLLLAGLGVIFTQSAQANANFTVNTTSDTHDADPGDGICADSNGDCSLRAAIEETNALTSTDVIDLPAGIYLLSEGQLWISDTLSLNGEAMTTTVMDGQQNSRILYINSALTSSQITVTLSRLMIQNGSVSGDGGGIWNSEILFMDHCGIQSNFASNRGGGVNLFTGSMTVNNCTINENSSNEGGGIFSGGGLTILHSTLISNTTNFTGGAIQSFGGLTILNSTVSDNTSNGWGGGISSYNFFTSEISHSTIVSNTADADNNGFGDGGGIYNNVGSLMLKDVIIANNIDNSGEAPDCHEFLFSEGFNLIEDLTGCFITTLPSDITGVDPLLNPLANNGGNTLTHALLPDSPARNSGICTDIDENQVWEDQRGISRPQGSNCDIGAFEYEEESPTPTPTPTSTPSLTPSPTPTITPSPTPTLPPSKDKIYLPVVVH